MKSSKYVKLLLFSLAIVISIYGKKCNFGGGGNPPPPSGGNPPSGSTHRNVIIPEPFLNQAMGLLGNNGNGGTPCDYDFSYNQTIELKIMFFNGSSNQQYGATQVYTQSDILGGSLLIEVPTDGDFWIEATIQMDDCTECCDQKLIQQALMGTFGCQPNQQQAKGQGQPYFKLMSPLYNGVGGNFNHGGVPVFQFEFVSCEFSCNCNNC